MLPRRVGVNRLVARSTRPVGERWVSDPREDASVRRLTLHGLSWLHMAMRRVGIADLKNNLSRHIRDVEAGEVVEVLDRARVVARIIPIEGTPASKVTIVPARRPFASVRDAVHRPMDPPVDALALLLEDRAARDWTRDRT